MRSPSPSLAWLHPVEAHLPAPPGDALTRLLAHVAHPLVALLAIARGVALGAFGVGRGRLAGCGHTGSVRPSSAVGQSGVAR